MLDAILQTLGIHVENRDRKVIRQTTLNALFDTDATAMAASRQRAIADDHRRMSRALIGGDKPPSHLA
jgi:hypothetical protein